LAYKDGAPSASSAAMAAITRGALDGEVAIFD
jgi:hypothetical protein